VSEKKVTVERLIDAPPERIFDVIADPSMHPRIDGSGSVQKTLGNVPDRLHEGAAFGMSMKIGLPYMVRNVVVEFEENRRIAWQHTFRHRWRWAFEPAGDGATHVTHSWTWSTAPKVVQRFLEVTNAPKKNRRSMERTLERLEQLVTEGSPAS
jgi:uncharacterized protein YndB with AHSA1/START domain